MKLLQSDSLGLEENLREFNLNRNVALKVVIYPSIHLTVTVLTTCNAQSVHLHIYLPQPKRYCCLPAVTCCDLQNEFYVWEFLGVCLRLLRMIRSANIAVLNSSLMIL